MTEGSGDALSIMVGSGAPGSSTKVAEFLFGSPTSAGDPGLGDFTGDGDLDVINGAGPGLELYVGGAGGTFSGPVTITVGGIVANVRIEDIDGDGQKDIAYSRTDGVIGVLLNQGGGSFGTAITFQTSLNEVTGRSFFVGDVNRDGIKDIVVGTSNSANAEVFLANSSTSVGTNKIETISGLSIATASDARTTLDAIDPLMSRLTTFASSIGASLSRMENATRNLETSRDQKVISAARITDVDIAQESAALIRSQILQNIATAILAQANSQPALALQLLKYRPLMIVSAPTPCRVGDLLRAWRSAMYG